LVLLYVFAGACKTDNNYCDRQYTTKVTRSDKKVCGFWILRSFAVYIQMITT